jgi:hypothetical protein
MTEIEKALNYYRSAVEHSRPDYVPVRVRLRQRVTGDFPYTAIYAEAGEHDCQSNPWGAISVQASNGQMLGVKPSEFDVLAWRLNAEVRGA